MPTLEELEQQRLGALREGNVQEESRVEQLMRAMQQHGPSLVSPGQPEYDQEATTAINESYARLSEILGAQPNVDFRGMAAPFFERVKSRPTQQMPGRAAAFAAGFAHPTGGESIMRRVAMAQQSEDQRERDLSQLEAKILDAQIEEAMTKGQSSRALATLKERQSLEHRLGRLRAREEQGFKVELEGVKAQQRAAQNNAIMDRIRERHKLTQSGKGGAFQEQVALQLVKAVVTARLSRNLLTGKRDLDEQDVAEIVDEVSNMLNELPAIQEPSVTPPKPGTKTPPPAAPPAAATGKKSRARETAERLQAEKNKKGR